MTTQYYTIQKCKKCGKNVKINAAEFLLNLDKPVLCKECRVETKDG